MTLHTESLFSSPVAGRAIACALHEVEGPGVVVFCHGFRGEKTGPSRTFVRAARRLASLGISSLRFDQYGSGDSAGDFLESGFTDWVTTISVLAHRQLDQGRRVALFGQSMGASAAICAAADLPLEALVAWVPDASVDEFTPDPRGFVEEGGQRVGNAFWQEAHKAAIPEQLSKVAAPCYLVFGTDDAYVSTANRQALIARAKPADRIDVFDGYAHSAWTADQADDIIERSTGFLADHLTPSGADCAEVTPTGKVAGSSSL